MLGYENFMIEVCSNSVHRTTELVNDVFPGSNTPHSAPYDSVPYHLRLTFSNKVKPRLEREGGARQRLVCLWRR